MIWLRCGNLFELLGQEWVASILFILVGGLITWILANIPDGMRVGRMTIRLYPANRKLQKVAKAVLKLSIALTVLALSTLLPFTWVKAASSSVLINAVYPDTYLSGEPEEAFQLINVSASPVALTNWTVTDFEGVITLTGVLAPQQTLWIARQANDFYLEFGFKPNFEYQSNTDPGVPDLVLSGSLALANPGDQLALFNALLY